VDQIRATYLDYRRHYAGWIVGKRVEGVEETGKIDLGGGYWLDGRVDLRFLDAARRGWIQDHKTTGRITVAQARMFKFSGQFMGYTLLGRALYGEAFEALIVSQVQWAQAGQPAAFAEFPVRFSPTVLQRYRDSLRYLWDRIKELEAADTPVDRWPRALHHATCFTRYGPCEFLNLCLYGVKGKKAGTFEVQV
jgi:hypothetical protein